MREPYVFREIEFHVANYAIDEVLFDPKVPSFLRNMPFWIMWKSFQKPLRRVKECGYASENESESIALLHAHGGNHFGEWSYGDGDTKQPIDNWIQKMQDRFSILLIYCCNPNNHEVAESQSFVIHPTSSIRPISALLSDRMRIFVPKVGYLE